MKRSRLFFLQAILLQACVRFLPPPRTPERVVPQLPMPTAPETVGSSHIAIEVTDGPARIERVVERVELHPVRVLQQGTLYGIPTRTRALVDRVRTTTVPVCVTPCVATLPWGPSELRVVPIDPLLQEAHLGGVEQQDSLEASMTYRLANTTEVVIGEGPAVLRVTLGRRRRPEGAQIAASLGLLASVGCALVGSLLLPPGGVRLFWRELSVRTFGGSKQATNPTHHPQTPQ